MAFEKIVNKETGTVYATLTQDGYIRVSLAAQKEVGMDKYSYATVLYDRVDKKIGLIFRAEKRPGDFKVCKSRSSIAISMQSLRKYECIRHRGRFKVVISQNKIVINLKEAIKL